MPSPLHEALVTLFRNRPELAPDLLSRALGLELPAFTEARIEDASLGTVRPAEYRADLVVLLADGVPVLGIIVEVQLARDTRKAFSWPFYLVSLRARFECPTCVLVFTTHEAIAEWARQPIELGPGSVVTPLVIGPSAVPSVTSDADAMADPELAVLSAMAHGRDAVAEAMTIATSAARAARQLDNEKALLYFDLIRHHLGDAARVAFEALMRPAGYEYQSDFARKYFFEGKAEGKAEGIAEGKAGAVVACLRAREIVLTADEEGRITACRDLAQLDRWLAAAFRVATAAELFEG